MTVLPWALDGRLLLVRSLESGRWQTIGGAVEIDETPQQAAVREAAEEAGADQLEDLSRALLKSVSVRR